MSVMFCVYCGNYLSQTWRYCPYCGRKISGESELFDALFRNEVRGISIQIISGGFRRQETRNKAERWRIPIEESQDRNEEHTLKVKDRKGERIGAESLVVPRRVEEPEGRIHRIGQHWIIRVTLPGVRKENIDVRKLETSIEVKAHKNGEAYFRQFEVPESARIISQHMEGDELVVEVG
ncbi:MAG: zinc-ribbon domain-containing protein [Theionarchaea archaeon]|nr:zinc-ribbon domain-containing protein [Theionarchaea archaeon]MBU7038415.1 zinc-ribbon domain-containing protein [Theionarchaea archaeon]